MDYLGAALLAASLGSIVLFTSLGGTTWGWGSPQVIGLMIASAILLPAFVWQESRAAEPILPLSLFRNHTFAVTSAIGFIVGFALFGAITYLPLYLQVTKGSSPTTLRPAADAADGRPAGHVDRERTGDLEARALPVLPDRRHADRGRRDAPAHPAAGGDAARGSRRVFALVLGLGLGMVMQVLVLAVQNSVDPSMMGVATSGSTLFRQIGGSIGVALFGTIFANRVRVELLHRLPPGTHVPDTINPAGIKHLPPAAHAAFADAFAAALHPVFFVAAAVSLLAFAPDLAPARGAAARQVASRRSRFSRPASRSKPRNNDRWRSRRTTHDRGRLTRADPFCSIYLAN